MHVIKSDVGVVRSENQDRAAVFHKGDIAFAILCDGMGGHQGGSHASSITIDTFEEEFMKKFPVDHLEKANGWFQKAIKRAKKEMTHFANKDQKLLDMGTTLTAAVITKDYIIVYNVGDSRTYVFNGVLTQVTRDHNLRNLYIDKFNYSEEKAATIMGAAALTSALGPKKKTNIDVFNVENSSDIKYVVLTSDGIHDYISKPVFTQILNSDLTMNNKAEELIVKAIKGKSSDNLTTIILEVNK